MAKGELDRVIESVYRHFRVSVNRRHNESIEYDTAEPWYHSTARVSMQGTILLFLGRLARELMSIWSRIV